jgi:hypothetical protein
VIGVDETLERRWGKKIAAKGVYRDPVRSTHDRFIKASGLRWVCLMLLVPVPWARRVWALPFHERPCSVRTLLCTARQAPQEDNRLGETDASVGKALVARMGDCCGGRFRLR